MGSHREMFASPDTLRAFCEKIILPNMSIRRELMTLLQRSIRADEIENEEEMFEDDPAEYIRRDLELSTGQPARQHVSSS